MNLFDLNLSRVIDATPEEVFAAWTDPDKFKVWMGAAKIISTPKVDGLFYIGMARGEKLMPHYGRFLRLEKPKLIEHTWLSESTEGLETTVTVSLEPTTGGTQMTLRHTGLPSEAQVENHTRGWTYIVGNLANAKARV